MVNIELFNKVSVSIESADVFLETGCDFNGLFAQTTHLDCLICTVTCCTCGCRERLGFFLRHMTYAFRKPHGLDVPPRSISPTWSQKWWPFVENCQAPTSLTNPKKDIKRPCAQLHWVDMCLRSTPKVWFSPWAGKIGCYPGIKPLGKSELQTSYELRSKSC